MKFKCKHCNQLSDAEQWNKETEKQCGEGITPIEQGINSNNWYYVCPECGELCYKKDREKGEYKMNNVIDKEKLIKSIDEKINYLNSEITVENNSRANELKDLIYVINKGCFDKVYNTNVKLDTYIKENSGIWDLTDTKEFLLYHKDDIIEILQKL